MPSASLLAYLPEARLNHANCIMTPSTPEPGSLLADTAPEYIPCTNVLISSDTALNNASLDGLLTLTSHGSQVETIGLTTARTINEVTHD